MGPYYNFIQVFGRNPLYWLLPFNLKGGKPVGDGVVWPHKPSSTQTYEVDVSIRDAVIIELFIRCSLIFCLECSENKFAIR